MTPQSTISAQEISEEILLAIKNIQDAPDIAERGVVMSMSDGIAWIWGLKGCGFHEMIEIDTYDGGVVQAFALNLEEDQIGAVVRRGASKSWSSSSYYRDYIFSTGRRSVSGENRRPAWTSS
jgi:F-type H+/Na+-transporting ATPase subunit alpha